MPSRFAEFSYTAEEGLTLRFKPRNLDLLPESTRGHLRAAKKELLLALRGCIDGAIERTEQRETDAHRPRRIQVRMGNGEEEQPENP